MTTWNKHISKFLSAYVHGELDKTRDEEVRAHLEECQRCLDRLAVIREGIRLASQLQRAEAPERMLQEIESRLAEPGKRPLHVERGFLWQMMPGFRLSPPRVVGIALLITITVAALIYFIRPLEKSKSSWDMSPFLEIAETSDDSTLTSISAIRPDGFLDVSRQAAYEALGFPGSTQIFPVNGFELTHQRIREFGKSKVVQFVLDRRGSSYTVFIAPPAVGFTIGERKAVGAQFGTLRAGKVERGAALSVFGEPPGYIADPFHHLVPTRISHR